MFCTHCGKEIPRGARFCTACGSKVSGAEAIPASRNKERKQLSFLKRIGYILAGFAGLFVLFCLGLFIYYIINPEATPDSTTPNEVLSSPPISEEASHYLQNTHQILSDFTKGVAEGQIKPGSIVPLSATTGSRTDTIDIWYLEGTETGTGFKVGLTSQFQKTDNVTMREIKGNIFLVSKQSAPAFSSLGLAGPKDDMLLHVKSALEFLGLGRTEIALAQSNPGRVFGVPDPPGGTIIIQFDTVTLKDRKGKVLGQFKYQGHDIEKEVGEVLSADVAKPNEQMIERASKEGAASVANSSIFSTYWDFQELIMSGKVSTYKQWLAKFLVSKTVKYDFKTKKYIWYQFIDFIGNKDGKDFEGMALNETGSTVSPWELPSWPGQSSSNPPPTLAPSQAAAPNTKPDLMATSVKFSPDSGKTGDKITVTFTVKNQSDYPSGSFKTQIYLAKTDLGTDRSLLDFDMASLKPWDNLLVTKKDIVIPDDVLPDSYWVTVFVDAAQKIDENDESNNVGSSDPNRFTITALPTTPTAPASVTIDSVKMTYLGRDYPGPTGRDHFDLEVSGTASGPVGAVFGTFWPTSQVLLTGSSWTLRADELSLQRKDNDPESTKWTGRVRWITIDGYDGILNVKEFKAMVHSRTVLGNPLEAPLATVTKAIVFQRP